MNMIGKRNRKEECTDDECEGKGSGNIGEDSEQEESGYEEKTVIYFKL